MNFATRILAPAAGLLIAASALASPHREEHVTGGALDLVWFRGFDVQNKVEPLTLGASDPAYANPSGDHTVAVATNSFAPDSGGIIVSTIDNLGNNDYVWEGWMFTGGGNTRRGLIVRATPENDFKSMYQFVIQSGLFQLNFRKLVAGAPTTLGTWFANTLPGGVPQVNTWHKMKVIALGASFRCFWDDYELTSAPIIDPAIDHGYAGVYNFRFDIGGVPVYFDDLLLSATGSTAARRTSFGGIKALYRN